MDFVFIVFVSAWCASDRISSLLFVRRVLGQVIQAQVSFFFLLFLVTGKKEQQATQLESTSRAV